MHIEYADVAEYRYFVTDLLSNTVLAELPFLDVSYERALKGAGNFSGKIPTVDETSAFDLYENTMPGKTALYVVRNNKCVWGGIIWTRSYTIKSRELTVNASEFTSYLHHRYIWKTYSHDYEATAVASGGNVTVTLTSGSFDFTAGSPVFISFSANADYQYNGTYSIAASPAPTATTFKVVIPALPNGSYTGVTVQVRVDTYDYVRQLVDEMLTDFSNYGFANSDIEPAKQTYYTVTNKLLNSNNATLTFSTSHDAVVGQSVIVNSVDSTFNGSHVITAVTSNTVSYEKTAANVPSTAVTPVTASIFARSRDKGISTLISGSSIPFAVGDLVEVAGVDDPGSPNIYYNGTRTVLSVDNSGGFGLYFITVDASDQALEDPVITSGSVSSKPSALIGTYGSFTANSDIGITYSTEAYSGVTVKTLDKIRRGYELKSVGDELDEYSDVFDGFEYRIDCDYDPSTSSFTRTFVLIPIDAISAYRPLAVGEVPEISWFGADKVVFEYPGNIMSASLDESAEDVATRFFMVGNDADLGQDTSQPYAAASATDLLLDGWPLLDKEETLTDTIITRTTGKPNPDGLYNEEVLQLYAKRYLSEFRPPVMDLKISVNGSFDPYVGTYAPGDWCSVIIDDYFIRLRLANPLELRSNVLLRKIESFSVSVPNNPAFPEEVSLNLVTEWDVDKRG